MKWRLDSEIQNWLPRLQAHRGYWVEGLQQNSLKSIQKAFELKFEMAEFDVRLTKDAVVVLFHDSKFHGQSIGQLTYQDLKNKTQKDYPDLVTLEQVLAWLSDLKKQNVHRNFKLNIEIKSNKILNARLEAETLRLIEKFDLSNSILISSFNPFSLYRFKKMAPIIYRARLLTNDKDSNFILRSSFKLSPL